MAFRRRSKRRFNRGNRFSRGFSRMTRFRRPSFRRSRRTRRYSSSPFKLPLVTRRTSSFLIKVAVIGGLLYFFKDRIKPLIEKIKGK